MGQSALRKQPEIEDEQIVGGTSLPERGPATPRRPVFPLWLSRLGVVVLVLIVVLGAVGEYVARHAEPMLKRRVVADLEGRFNSPVELDELHLSLLHGLQVTGGGLRILNIAGPARPDAHPERGVPMLSVQRFAFRSGVRALFEPTVRIVTVYVQGMQLNIPPKPAAGAVGNSGAAVGSAGPGGPGNPDDPKRRGQTRLGVAIDKIVCTDVTLTVETSNPEKPPLVFAIHTLTMTDVGPKKPLLYEAALMNPKPVGEIHSKGHFGPWQDDNPRDTPIDGQFTFTNVNLGTIRGLGGTLNGRGAFSGALGKIAVRGSDDTPDFSLDVSHHPVALHNDFEAVVDGTSGDTTLQQVRATLAHTVLLASGTIIRLKPNAESDPPGFPGHDIELTVMSDQARIEDLLALGVKTEPTVMRGALTIRARLSIKPGPVSVEKKMQLTGTFAIRGAMFSNPRFQETVDKLSVRAQGRPEEVNAAPVVASEMSGRFSLANAVLHLPAVDYQVPGAKVHLGGDYSLDGERFEFAGTVRTEATASEMLTGWKSLLAMPFDKFLKKHGAGVEVPIKVSGTKSAPKFGVDLDKMGLGFLSHHNDEPQPVRKPGK